MDFKTTDPELYEIFTNFQNEVKNTETAKLDDRTRYLAILAALLGCQGKDMFKQELFEALEAGVNPVEIREVVYQSVDYLGMGRVYPFVKTMNKVFMKNDVNVPLPSQATVTADDRLQKGVQTQAEIFGDEFLEAWKKGDINRWLGSNCFGDFYTRKGLSLKDREMVTFCFLMGQGGTDPQMVGHAFGNMNMGNDRDFMLRVIDQCVPFIGYPRCLNAITALNKVYDTLNKNK